MSSSRKVGFIPVFFADHEKKKLVRAPKMMTVHLRTIFFFARLFSFQKEKSGDFVKIWAKKPEKSLLKSQKMCVIKLFLIFFSGNLYLKNWNSII
jgi:hypothetical protein